jgi:probable rRNA maturation factor
MATAATAGPDAAAAQAPTVDVQIACDAAGTPDRRFVRHWVANALAASGRQPPGEVEVSVRVVSNSEIRRLNARYRQRDRATNVLAFPAGPVDGLPAGLPAHLGDIVVCADVVAAEAGRQGKALADHWAHMLVHGALHLLGFDHGSGAEAAEMEGLETRILAAGGVLDPYASR